MRRKTILITDADRFSLSRLWSELAEYRDLFWVFAYRDFRVRYAQTMIGLVWAVIQPVVTLLIFIVVFQYAVKVPTGGVPYPLLSLTGLGAWAYFSFLLREAGASMINSSHIVKKIYFPRAYLPASKTVVALVEWAVVWVFTVVLMVYYGKLPPVQVLVFPVWVLLTTLSALGTGFWLCGLTIRYRDFQHVIPFAVQIGVYISPVAYPAYLIPDSYRLYYYLNPMAGLIDGIRWSLLGSPFPVYGWISVAAGLLLFVTGFYYFTRTERIMADYL